MGTNGRWPSRSTLSLTPVEPPNEVTDSDRAHRVAFTLGARAQAPARIPDDRPTTTAITTWSRHSPEPRIPRICIAGRFRERCTVSGSRLREGRHHGHQFGGRRLRRVQLINDNYFYRSPRRRLAGRGGTRGACDTARFPHGGRVGHGCAGSAIAREADGRQDAGGGRGGGGDERAGGRRASGRAGRCRRRRRRRGSGAHGRIRSPMCGSRRSCRSLWPTPTAGCRCRRCSRRCAVGIRTAFSRGSCGLCSGGSASGGFSTVPTAGCTSSRFRSRAGKRRSTSPV